MHEIYLSYSKNTTLPLGIGSLHSDSHPFTHFYFDTFTSLLGLFNWHTDSHPFTHFYFDTFTSLTDHQLPFMPCGWYWYWARKPYWYWYWAWMPYFVHWARKPYCHTLTSNSNIHQSALIYIIPHLLHPHCLLHLMILIQTIYIQTPHDHVTYRTPIPTYFTQPVSQMTSPIHWCIVVLTTIRSSSRICSMHHTISRAHLYTSLRFQNSAIHFQTDSTPPTYITTHALPHIAYLWTLHNVYRTMHYPPISNLIRLCTKYNSTIHRYDMTPLVHTYTTESSSIHFNGDRPHSVPVRAIPVNYGSTNIPDHCHLCFQMIHILQP